MSTKNRIYGHRTAQKAKRNQSMADSKYEGLKAQYQADRASSQEARTEAPIRPAMSIASVPVQLVTEQRTQSHQILTALTKTAVALAGKDGGVAQVEIMERLWSMQKDAEDRQSEREFGIAKVALSMDLPPIPKNHCITYVDKNNEKRETPYADRGDIEGVLDPLCRKHGFSKEYSTETNDKGLACQVLVVRHVSGHKVVYRSPFMPLDGSGNKNNNQAAGSTAEYGKRYALVGAFNIIGVDKDDDGSKTSLDGSGEASDKFSAKVQADTQNAPVTDTKPKLTLPEAAAAFEIKLRNMTIDKRGEYLMRHIDLIRAMETNSPELAAKSAELRALCNEPTNG